MNIKLLTEHRLEFLSLRGGRIGSSESTLVKMPHCWKPRVVAQLCTLDVRFFLMSVSGVFSYTHLYPAVTQLQMSRDMNFPTI